MRRDPGIGACACCDGGDHDWGEVIHSLEQIRLEAQIESGLRGRMMTSARALMGGEHGQS